MSNEFQNEVLSILNECQEKAYDHYRVLVRYSVNFKLRGRTAGRARLTKDRQIILSFNQQLEKVDNASLRNTVVHEFSHAVVFHLYNMMGVSLPPHGWQWKRIMLTLGEDPARTHNYAFETAHKTFPYSCGCEQQVHKLSIVRHRRFMLGRQYCCRNCKQLIKPMPLKRKINLGD